jgi:hypothetical protein
MRAVANLLNARRQLPRRKKKFLLIANNYEIDDSID